MTTGIWVAVYLGAINLATFAAFGWDKRQAQHNGQRISESSLLLLSFAGGSLAAKFAQKRFRHKTQKQPFGLLLNVILCVQLLCLPAAMAWIAF